MFINHEYMNEFDAENLLDINEENDQYRSYSSTTSDIDESYEANSISTSDDYSDDVDSFFSSDEMTDKKLDDEPQQSFTHHHGAIDYVDVRPHRNLHQYLNNSPKIPDDINQRPKHVNIDLSDDHIKKVSEANQPDKPIAAVKQKKIEKSPRRLYVKTTEAQRNQLIQLFNIHQDTWPIQKYAIETGIREKNCQRLIKKIKNNEPLESQNHVRGRKPKIDVKQIRILESTIKKNPYVTLKQLQQKLEDDSDLKVSKSQIWESIVGNSKVSKRSGCYVYSFKMASRRDPNSNSLDNKL